MQYDRNGQEITLLDWVMKMGDADYREVAFTEIKDAKIVTNWIGVPSGYDREDRPNIFETTVYDIGAPVRTRRYASEPEALTGHVEECGRMRTIKRVA